MPFTLRESCEWMKRHEILGTPVDALTYGDAVKKVRESIGARKSIWILAINPEKIMKTLKDRKLKELLLCADLFIPDGVGILLAGKILGKPFRQRVTGVDLLMALVAEAAQRKWRIYLLGAEPGVAEAVAQKLEESYPGLEIAGTRDGYFKQEEEKAVVAEIKASKPDLLFVGMGSPKQEEFIQTYRQELAVPVCMGVGGSFDVISGKKKRAPMILQKLGLEWSWRLVKEPTRIARMSVLPKFMLLVLKEKFGLLKFEEE